MYLEQVLVNFMPLPVSLCVTREFHAFTREFGRNGMGQIGAMPCSLGPILRGHIQKGNPAIKSEASDI
ncbi:hypothetical protein [Peribacillus simplex]|uniref:Uncharacterized protein n=1 Tax=Peribacillus simplex NBRC 15720 = DSM 1321 TaxID=1349754 RepID=A0A223EHK3_9BACI|nr:hypothetical protein [Peribacillus simplex]ASS94702.1 hypothetical protein BS1321_12715 [Peribacillus simplex NBRC 15720 = DSM 1321]MEC1396845.1 hypothetical protein [Peribacillus simplex]MED3908173.1 hypothetical protein [Peribacillus simplex]